MGYVKESDNLGRFPVGCRSGSSIDRGGREAGMQQHQAMFSREEQESIAINLASSKDLVDQIAECLKTKLSEEQQLVVRAEEAQAALQRLEWQLERSLGVTEK